MKRETNLRPPTVNEVPVQIDSKIAVISLECAVLLSEVKAGALNFPLRVGVVPAA